MLRLWELAGKGGDCTVTLPDALKFKSAQPLDLRGRPAGDPLQIRDGKITVPVKPFAPLSLKLASQE